MYGRRGFRLYSCGTVGSWKREDFFSEVLVLVHLAGEASCHSEAKRRISRVWPRSFASLRMTICRTYYHQTLRRMGLLTGMQYTARQIGTSN